MGYQKIGDMGQLVRSGSTVEARNLKGGDITAEQLVLGGGTKGVVRSQNFVPSPLAGWAIFGDGSASFGSDIVFAGDLYSSNWDGAIPILLDDGPSPGHDSTATTGFAFDSSKGALQVEGKLYIGGSAFVLGGGVVQSSNFQNLSDPWSGWQLRGTDGELDLAGDLQVAGNIKIWDSGSAIQVYSKSGIGGGPGSVVGYIGYAPTGYGASEMVISTETNTDSIRLDADGEIEFHAGGSGSQAVDIFTNGVGVPANLFGIHNAAGTTTHYMFDDASFHTKGNDITMEGGNIYGDEGKVGAHIKTHPSGTWIAFYNGQYGPLTYSDRVEVRQSNLDIAGKLRHYQNTGQYIQWQAVQTRIVSTYGYVDLAPANASWAHFNTDRANFYFNKTLNPAGGVENYSTSDNFSWRQDTNTYVYRQTTDHIGLRAGGKEGLVVTDNAVHISKDDAYGTGSSFFNIPDTFKDIGNHETLRADRLGGGTWNTSEVGYYSSSRVDPETGKVLKADYTHAHIAEKLPPQIDGPASFQLEWIDWIDPGFYQRTQTKEAAVALDGKAGWEFGFALEDLAQVSPYLTTKPGERIGHSPDEMALIGVLWAGLRDARARIASLEERLERAGL